MASLFHKFQQKLNSFKIDESSRFYKYIPHLRIIDESTIDTEYINAQVEPTKLEYRDESQRSRWKIFDEYEYRLNKYEKARHKWWYWYEDNTSTIEKKLLLKLDFLVVFYSLIIFWLKSLDSSNFEKAYSSGMKEALGFKGNDYINTQTVFNVGSVVFQFPFMYLFPRYSLHYIIPILDVFWGIFTLSLYRVETVGQTQALRFIVSLFEAGFYPGFHYLVGSWYKSYELGRRTQLWYIGNYIGVLSSGLFQGSIYEHFDGNGGLEGFRWMFVIDGVITIFFGLGAYFVIPGTPDKCYSLFLTDEEILVARRRLQNDDNKVSHDQKPVDFFSWELWKFILTDWKIWGLTIFDISGWNASNASGSGFIFWLKSLKKYSIPKMNNLSSTSGGIGIVLLLIFGFFADNFRSRYGAIILSQTLNAVCNIILAVWEVPEGAKWFAFMFQYAGWATASVRYAWINDFLRHDSQVRAIVFIFQFAFAQSTTVWINRLIWPTVEAPRYLKGYTAVACFAFTMILAALVLLWKYKIEERKNAFANGIVLYNSSLGETPEEVFELRKQEASSLRKRFVSNESQSEKEIHDDDTVESVVESIKQKGL